MSDDSKTQFLSKAGVQRDSQLPTNAASYRSRETTSSVVFTLDPSLRSLMRQLLRDLHNDGDTKSDDTNVLEDKDTNSGGSNDSPNRPHTTTRSFVTTTLGQKLGQMRQLATPFVMAAFLGGMRDELAAPIRAAGSLLAHTARSKVASLAADFATTIVPSTRPYLKLLTPTTS